MIIVMAQGRTVELQKTIVSIITIQSAEMAKRTLKPPRVDRTAPEARPGYQKISLGFRV